MHSIRNGSGIQWLDILSSSDVGGSSYALSGRVPFGGCEAN